MTGAAPGRSLTFVAPLAAVLAMGGCSSVSHVRVQPEHVATPAGTRPIAVVQANATTLNLLFLKIPGGVSLDRVVNQELIVRAKNLGADKVVITSAHVDPEDGIWFLWRILGWQSAEAVGVAVIVDGAPPDPDPMAGPEASGGSHGHGAGPSAPSAPP